MVEHCVEATYLEPPAQLYPHEVMDLLRPIMFSDKGKVGHNVKFDLETVRQVLRRRDPTRSVPRHHRPHPRPGRGPDELRPQDADRRLVQGAATTSAQTWYPNLGKQGTDNFGLDEVARYLAKDIRYCLDEVPDLIGRLERKGLRQVYDFEMQVYPSIMTDGVARLPDRPLPDGGGARSTWSSRSLRSRRRPGRSPGISSLSPTSTPSAGCCSGRAATPTLPAIRSRSTGSNKVKLKSQNLRVRSRTEKRTCPR